MKIGDELLVVGTAFFEKTTVKSKNKGIWYLENGIQVDRDLKPLNSKYKVEKFDQEKYDFLMSKRILSQGLEKLNQIIKSNTLTQDQTKYFARKIQKLVEKLN